MKNNKVIGIGFHKTGTSTLNVALSKLGYNVLGARIDLAERLIRNEIDSILELTESYDAFEDNPWPLIFKDLDKKYPNSKFILTIRDEEKWLSSIVNHFGSTNTSMREFIYGVGHPAGNEDIYLKRYQKHNKDVLEYFKDRKSDLLIIDWSKIEGWNELCEFIGEPILNEPLPHANKGNYKKNGILHKIKKIISRNLS